MKKLSAWEVAKRVLTIVLILVLIGSCTVFTLNAFMPEIFEKDEEAGETAKVVDGNGNELFDETKVYPLTSNMAFVPTSVEVMATATPLKTVTVTATITPSTATYKSVDWVLAFANPSSTWANGKTLSNYVTVTPSEDGSTTATINFFEAFGEQIKLTVTSRDNANAKATCNIDCQRVITSATVTVANSTNSYLLDNSSEASIATLKAIKFTSTSATNDKYKATVNAVESVGTLAASYTVDKCYFELMSNFSALVGGSYTSYIQTGKGDTGVFGSVTSYNINQNSIAFDYSFFKLLLSFQDHVYDAERDDDYTSHYISKTRSTGYTVKNLAYVRLLLKSGATTVVDTRLYCSIDLSAIAIGVTGLTISNGTLTF